MAAKLKVGWADTESRPSRRGPIAGQDIPTGPRHAVREGDDHALCGARIVWPDDQDWPGEGMIGSLCRSCRDNADPAVVPLGHP
jgi:hypothetical protein